MLGFHLLIKRVGLSFQKTFCNCVIYIFKSIFIFYYPKGHCGNVKYLKSHSGKYGLTKLFYPLWKLVLIRVQYISSWNNISLITVLLINNLSCTIKFNTTLSSQRSTWNHVYYGHTDHHSVDFIYILQSWAT